MASLDELPFSLRLFLKTYRWRRIDPIPWAEPRKPVAESRVALISSAGFVLPGQPPFDQSRRGGDPTHRIIAATADVRSLVNTHRSESFDPSGIEIDPNLAFPIDRMHELEAEGTIGEFSPRAVSVMGSITAPRGLVRDTAPQIAALLLEDGADLALLVPL
jgi:D-proline reductase (dithiol) PrdB